MSTERILPIIRILNENKDYGIYINNIKEAMEILNGYIEELRGKISEDIASNISDKLYEKAKCLLRVSEEITQMQEELDEVIEEIIGEMIEDIEPFQEEMENSHSLKEDYKGKRIKAFEFNGMRHKVSRWNDMLLRVSEILYDIDKEKIKELADSEYMKGRRIFYVSKENIEKKNERIKNSEYYIWTYTSANGIIEILKKLLCYYNIEFEQFSIYLEESPTIGIYVREKIRRLSQQKYCFNEAEIAALKSSKWCSDNLGIYYPLLKEYDSNKGIDEQLYEGKSRAYWKEIFEFNEKKYWVYSIWYDKFKDKFDKWYSSLNL